MKTIKFRMYLGTGLVGSDVEEWGKIEVEDGTPEEEIERMIEEYTRDWMFDHIDWGFNIESEDSE